MNRFRKRISNIIKLYCIYFIITCVLIFAIHHRDTANIINIKDYYSNEESLDRAFVVEDMDFSAIIKMDLIDNAKDKIDISYYKIQNDIAGDVFFAKLLEAADRGVKVRIVLDGKINKIGKDFNGLNNLIASHPNIDIRYYDNFNLLKPWTFNNVLHDKFIIVDDTFVLLGGRNIGNQYFAIEEISSSTTNDREVLVINAGHTPNSAIAQINEYFITIWNNKYTKEINRNLSNSDKRKALLKRKELKTTLSLIEEKYPRLFNTSIDYFALSHPTNKITLIHNSVERFKKNPICLKVIASLMNNAKYKITMQSPYIIPTLEMREYFDFKKLSDKEIEVLTNSEYSTPNIFAFAGYLKYRDSILNSNVDIYEYQNGGSIHAKSYIIDDRLSIIGSFNMDSRSAFLSTETIFVIDSVELSEELQKKIDKLNAGSVFVSDTTNSNLIKESRTVKSIVLRIIKYLTYPFTYLL